MTKAKILKIVGIVSAVVAFIWAVVSVKLGFLPFRSIQVIGQVDGPTSTFVAYIGKGAQALSWIIRVMPVILTAVSVACFLIRKKVLKKGECHE